MKSTLLGVLSLVAIGGLRAGAEDPKHSIHFPVPSKEDGLYDKIWPRYVEVCGVSQMRSADGKPAGGPFGHATAFVKGICLDKDFFAPATRVKKCDANADLTSPESGTGFSAAGEFMNVRWIGSQGKRLFFHGLTLQPEEPYSSATSLRDKQAMLDAFTTWGVILKERAMPRISQRKEDQQYRRKFPLFWQKELILAPAQPEYAKARDAYIKLVLAHKAPTQFSTTERESIHKYQEVVTNNSIGTDMALDVARNSYCAKVPITEAQTDLLVSFLNDENDQYRDLKKVFNWTSDKDNCAHMVHDILWKVGMRGKLLRNLFRPLNYFQIAVPMKEPAVVGYELTHLDLSDPAGIFTSYPEGTWERLGWFPSPEGVMSEFIPARGRDPITGAHRSFPADSHGNEYFQTDAFAAIGDLLTHREVQLEDFMLSPQTTDIRVNLKHAAEVYAKAQQTIADDRYEIPRAIRENATWLAYFERFEAKFATHLDESEAAVRAKLELLDRLTRP